ncbi:MAG TPA: non-homologous end-joining DNA ligase [Pyrinomonadaceae bacterium]|jgi:bifunctional non-homologous end joining protein LigD|nr:non-homologous end-joining DNA ligase [Pyrinomonadaceae bacterium]
MSLETYHQKRDFTRTPEPEGKLSKSNRQRFVVQEHHASKLHFDFRLEMGGVLKSWSVPKGPSLDPSDKRLAMPTEDHPVEYLKFEGHIPEGNYGAGEHLIWDAGTYELLTGDDPLEQLAEGKLNFRLKGDKLRGGFNLVRMGHGRNQWLLIKSRDEDAQPGWQLRLRLATNGESETESKIARKRERKHVSHQGVSQHGTKAGKQDGPVMSASALFKSGELSGDVRVKAGRDVASLTHLDKVYWPDDGYTKGDLVSYYYQVSKYILPYLKHRPLIMKRYPEGIEGFSFHQHNVDEAPDYVRTASLDVEEGHAVDYIVGDNLATLLYMANLGSIERHPWHSRIENLDHPDWLVFDLDPGEGIAYSTICELAVNVRDALAELDLECYPKTSGSRGMHVYVPLKPVHDYELVAEFALGLATLVARRNPTIATVERALKKRRRGQIYLDHMQNARGKSVVAPYSVRPRARASVSAPLEWKEVQSAKITPQDFTIKNLQRRVARKGDLFKPVLTNKQSLKSAAEQLKSILKETTARPAKASVKTS